MRGGAWPHLLRGPGARGRAPPPRRTRARRSTPLGRWFRGRGRGLRRVSSRAWRSGVGVGGVRGGRWREGCRGTSDWTPVRRCRFPFRNLKREKPAFLSSRASTLRRRLCKPDKRGNGDPRGSQSFGVNREEIRQLYPGGSGSRSGLLGRSLESVPA